MGRVWQRKRGLDRPGAGVKLPGWYATWTDEAGRKRTKKAGKTQREAKDFLREVEGEVERRKRRPGWQAAADGSIAFGAYVEEYLESVVDGGNRLKSSKERHTHLDAWVEHLGKHTPLRDIGPVPIRGFVNKLRRKERTPATCNRYLASLRHLFNTAISDGRLPFSPLASLKPLPEENERTRVISPKEETKLLAAAGESRNKLLRPLIIVALETCARPDELLALRWSDVDLERRLVTFRKTKAKRTRQVPLTSRAIEALSELGTRFGKTWVFAYQGERWLDSRDAFEGACKRAGIPYGMKKEGGLVFRDTRRTAITRLAERGVPAAVIQRYSGHETLAMVQRYTAVSDEAVRAVVDALDRERKHMGNTATEDAPGAES